MRIKNILIDWFELFTYGIYGKGEMGRLVETIGLSREAYMEKDEGETWELHHLLNRGLCNERYYWESLIESGNWKVTPDQLMALTDEVVKCTIPGTADTVWQLRKQGYRLILVSDLWEEMKERVLLNYPWIMQLFDARYFSCDFRMIKSDPGFFEFILACEEINPEETLFIDDYYVNVERAAETGIRGIVFENALQMKQELTRVLA